MSDIENFKIIIENNLGLEEARLKKWHPESNPLLKNLNSLQVSTFLKNLETRLKRLKLIYKENPNYYKEIVDQILNMASRNWEGAFSEIAVFDYFNQDILGDQNVLTKPVKPNVTISNRKTFAYQLGKSKANLDGFIQDINMYFDVKCLKDNVGEMFSDIFRSVYEHFGTYKFHISPEYNLDIEINDIRKTKQNLLEELKNSIDPSKRTSLVSSKILDELNYRLIWGQGLSTAVSTYNPYLHAFNFHKLIFKNADQFLKNKPCFIVYLSFPWFNGIITDFSNSNIQFYRAFARRVFCQYHKDKSRFSDLNKNFKGKHTINTISKYISGIIFLEDRSITEFDINKPSIKSYVYLNPNAKNPIKLSSTNLFIQSLKPLDFDDFYYDNY